MIFILAYCYKKKKTDRHVVLPMTIMYESSLPKNVADCYLNKTLINIFQLCRSNVCTMEGHVNCYQRHISTKWYVGWKKKKIIIIKGFSAMSENIIILLIIFLILKQTLFSLYKTNRNFKIIKIVSYWTQNSKKSYKYWLTQDCLTVCWWAGSSALPAFRSLP